ncbi:MAG: 30S ribosomal protein S4 [Nitrospira sp.]|nr:30S ribosomal protein S4 [Nitrospira sp.]MCB9709944.1 30S ribosomal protein S4 [Nitrospiraceae bacterium]MDR4487166.1 30S ribosomal protein S4 [Nitrospirales bacterium]MCA9465374.1 30S ribosomal protein S4 [Nitrospira sp.]MCA9474635.1 30S ribosomal protein S4 [Nitrospira sp.]
MAKYSGPVCRLCRREGVKLFLKGTRCMTEKCAIERRSYPPGQHGQSRKGRVTEYGTQLREKQKLRRVYGMQERQFLKTYHLAERKKGITGEHLLSLLERRLDNVVYRLGFAASRGQARQLVNHGHFLLNGKKMTIPSVTVNVGDTIEVKEKSRQMVPVQAALEVAEGRGIPVWLDLDRQQLKGTVQAVPTKQDIDVLVNEQVVVELYSR